VGSSVVKRKEDSNVFLFIPQIVTAYLPYAKLCSRLWSYGNEGQKRSLHSGALKGTPRESQVLKE